MSSRKKTCFLCHEKTQEGTDVQKGADVFHPFNQQCNFTHFDTCSQFVYPFISTTFVISHDMFDRSEALLNPILVTAMVTNINECICISFLGVWDHGRRAVW